MFADFEDEKLDVFFPDGTFRVLSSAHEARAFYRDVLKRQLFPGPGVTAGGLWRKPRSEGSPLAQAIADIMVAMKPRLRDHGI